LTDTFSDTFSEFLKRGKVNVCGARSYAKMPMMPMSSVHKILAA
jgi:hypothetical protein